jgi:DNA-binding NarL/FixJ family response regulator
MGNFHSIMIHVLIAEDHSLVRRSIRALLENADGIQVVGEAENGEQAVALTEKLQPDVVVMDISMPQMDGIQATERIHASKSQAHVIILSMYGNTNLIKQALQKGASGYLLKRSATEELVKAIRTASRGEIYLSPSIPDIPSFAGSTS